MSRLLLVFMAGCGPSSKAAVRIAGEGAQSGEGTSQVGKKQIQPPLSPENAPPPSPRLSVGFATDRFIRPIESWFDGHRSARTYIQLDKPLYRPGETVWFKSWTLRSRSFEGADEADSTTFQLISPKGAVVLEKYVQSDHGLATNDFVLPASVPGGEYLLRATAGSGTSTERPFVVSAYEAPRVKKTLEFVRKAYGKGDTVKAAVEIKRPTGEALANHPVEALVQLDGAEIYRTSFTTNAFGGVMVQFELPAHIENGDGLLTVLVDDGGVTESISKRIPIVLNKMRLSLFPEGGTSVTGLSSRVYFEAQNTLGKPADIEGRIVDDHNHTVAAFSSYHQGMGRFEYRPASGRRYSVKISKPEGIDEVFDLPLAVENGCTLRSFDDFDSRLSAIRVAVACSAQREVTVAAVQRDTLLDVANVSVPAMGEAVVYLESKDKALARSQGIARVTVFTDNLEPLAERLVYRNRRNSLTINVKPAEPSYTPRDEVKLSIETQDTFGEAVAAEVCLSVVDDTVISYADDKTGHMLSRLYLESEIPDKVEEPNVYFDLTEEKAARGIDLLLGTKGWRNFEWREVLQPVDTYRNAQRMAVESEAAPEAVPVMPIPEAQPVDKIDRKEVANKRPERAEKKGRAFGARPAARKAAAPNFDDFAPKVEEDAAEAAPLEDVRAPVVEVIAREMPAVRDLQQLAADKDWDGAAAEGMDAGWAKVRVFPVPDYRRTKEGARTDFRDTVFFSPSVKTDRKGRASVSFYLSDAVTSFRIFAEGIGGGEAGRVEKVLKSNLPFSMNIKVPTEVSSGDRMTLPLTLTNETVKPLVVTLDAAFGDLMKMDDTEKLREMQLQPRERKSLVYDVAVTGVQGESKVSISANAGGLTDAFERSITVVPRGFPVEQSRSGEVSDRVRHELDFGDASPGSTSLEIKAYPSPTATMIAGMDGMLQQPSGCFEQASSGNYPNVMIMEYLERHGEVDPSLTERSRGFLEEGYRLLTGYESPEKGYEWFGQNPGHEALTAYGLLEFVDMKRVYDAVDRKMIDRTAAWLKARRDGKGGFRRNQLALDAFGAASPEVTDAYITYSLTEAGFGNEFSAEIAKQAEAAKTTADAYLLALAANTLLNVPGRVAEGKTATARLAAMQSKSGAWTNADHSITRSGGINLHIETTALSILALLKIGTQMDTVTRGIEWLTSNRDGYGNWGATQATVLGLKAFSAYTEATRKADHQGTLRIFVNGEKAAEMAYEAGHKGPLGFSLKEARFFKPGKNTVELVHEGEGKLPYSIAVQYRSEHPVSSAIAPIDLEVTSSKERVKLGETVRFTARVTNKTNEGLPMTLARIGLPGGLTFQTWQLKELRDKKRIDFYETRAREVILYFRAMAPSDTRDIPLDLVAQVPGAYTGPASSAYLYYTVEHKTWASPETISITK